jgi:hypothetical protein
MPSIQLSTAGVYEMCRKRLARGGVRSQPSADTVEQHAQRTIKTTRTTVFDTAPLVLKAMKPVGDARISATVRRQCLEKLFTVEQPPQLSQIHRLFLQSKRPGRPEGPLVGGIAVGPRIGAVVLSLEQQIGHLPGSRVEQIGG